MRKASQVALRDGRRPSRLIGLWAAVVLATVGVAAVANVPSPEGIQGTGHLSVAAGPDGIEGSG